MAAGASCDRQPATSAGDHEGAQGALERAESGDGESSHEPLPGVDVEALSPAETDRFYELVDSLSSPCGAAHSLRTSVVDDDECRRSVYAARYVAKLIGDGAGDIDVRQFYDERYRDDEPLEFSTEDVPRKGPSDARVQVVEFLDYGCPACREFDEISSRAQAAWPSDVAVYYRFFPLANNPHGMPAAQAAVAAMRQGKFEEMHEALFRNQRQHDPASLRRYAEDIGLDMEQFEEDFAEAEQRVERDSRRGHEIGVRATPTVYVNGRRYTDPTRFDYVKLWIEEELAVNR